jgi:hypothetical protein
MLFHRDLILIQGKKQFDCKYATDPHFEEVKSRIQPGIVDTGVLWFEPLGNSQDPVRFHFEITGTNWLRRI